MDVLHLDFSGVGLSLSGLKPTFDEKLRRECSVFVRAVPSSVGLCTEVVYRPGAIPQRDFAPHEMQAVFETESARFVMDEGTIEIGANGKARVELIDDDGLRVYHTLLNLLRAGTAWYLPRCNGAMLHAAGLIVEGRGFVLVGSEGAGKSTWAGIGEAAGLQVVSDDIVLVQQGPPGFEVLGSPFRSTNRAPLRHGRWPLAAILFSRHGAPPALAPCAAMLARARITANLPFVAAGVDQDPHLAAVVDRLVHHPRLEELTFAPDPGFLELLRELPA